MATYARRQIAGSVRTDLWPQLRRRTRVVTLGIASVLLCVSLVGCSAPSPLKPTGAVRAVATTTQIADFTSQVVGNTGAVASLIRPNQTAHNFDPSARDLVDVGEAQALLVNGLELEPWLDGVVDASGFSGELVMVSAGIPLIDHDPHVWTSPRNAVTMVANIAAGLARARPDLADTFARNAATYEHRLDLLASWCAEAISSVPPEKRLLVTNHDALAYFVEEYDITFLGAILPSLDDNAEPSAADVDRLVALLIDSGATAVFSENSVSPKLAATIATEAGVRVYSGDEALYADSLGSPSTSGSTYIGATIHNVTILVSAWGGTVPPLPEGLL